MTTAKLEKLLTKISNNDGFRDQVNSTIESIMDKIERGESRNQILRRMKGETQYFSEEFELAISRLRCKKKFSRWNKIWLDSYSSSYSTPEVIGNYRSERLKGSRIIDLGAGAGMQSIMFSMNSDVTAVEIERSRTLMMDLNSREYSSTLKSLNEDVFKFLQNKTISSEDTVFSDPLRIRDSSGNITLSPDLTLLRKRIVDLTDKYVFDLPPLTGVNSIDVRNEAEYISVDRTLSRLSEYSSRLAENQSSAVLLPERRIFSGERRNVQFESGTDPHFLSIPDVALVSAHLLYKAMDYGSFFLCSEDKRRVILGSSAEPQEDFPGEVYEIIFTGSYEEIRDKISELRPKKVLLRYSISSEEYYRTVSELNIRPGDGESCYIFHFDSNFALCFRIT